ncbi:MAG TPA: HlyD family efflux transporter periplasmic adaptor subunit [Polyangiales bacterium]|nr:HlyD family efflux transporter periplasmic adaptor subunit [Polyangiales bacterium]
MKRVMTIVVVMAAALVVLIAWRIRAQSQAARGPAGGSGVIEADGIELAPRIAGRVLRVAHGEGQAVNAGDVVLELDCEEPNARLLEAQARLEAARATAGQAAANARAALGQRAAAQASVGVQGASTAALLAQQELASRDAERYEQMGEHAALSVRDRTRSQASELADKMRASRASELVSRQQAGAAGAQADAAAAAAEAALRNVAAFEATVTTARIAVDECTVRAPHAGVLERVYYDPGELVGLGMPVARLIDPSAVELTFYLANVDVAAARVGTHAEVRADAYPERVFQAQVKRVAREAEFTPRNVQTRSDRDRLVYPVELRIEDPEHALRTGMQAVATVQP